MSEYMPTKSDIAVAYRLVELGHFTHPDVMDKRDMQEVDAEFDRWLASVKAEALREAAEGYKHVGNMHARGWLLDRADQIEGATE